MTELIGRLVAGIGIDHNAAKMTVVITRECIADTSGKIGDAFGEIVGAPPALSQFV